jgi:hypothetical protein
VGCERNRKGVRELKQQVSPAIMAIVIVIVVAIAGFFLYHAATEKPTYPGLNAPQPGRVPRTPEEAAKAGIPGVNPNAVRPGASQAPANPGP